jgi:uncharacterized membrane protein
MKNPGREGIKNERWRAAEAEWRNPANWRWGLFYVGPPDSRVWLRQGDPEFGWTFNFVHRASWRWQACLLVGLLALIVAHHWIS